MLYGEGISREGSALDMAIQVGVVKKSGSWFTYEGDQLGQGRENVRNFLKDNPAITEEIENKVKVEFGLIDPMDQFAEDDATKAAAEADKNVESVSASEKNADSKSTGAKQAGSAKTKSTAKA